MATLRDEGWTLDNAEFADAHRRPSDPPVPSADQRAALLIGDMAQLVFIFLNKDQRGRDVLDRERVWVTVTQVSGNAYHAMLEQRPAMSDALAPGATVHFRPEHVFDIVPRSRRGRSHVRAMGIRVSRNGRD